MTAQFYTPFPISVDKRWTRAGTKTTPALLINAQTGKFVLKGNSNPENALEFYEPLFDYFEKLSQNPPALFEASFTLEYFNTSSIRCIFVILKKLQAMKQNGCTVSVLWHYEEGDDDMLESGEDFADLLNIDFNYVMLKLL